MVVDIQAILKKKVETVSKTEFLSFVAEFEELREGLIKKNYKLEQELDKIKDCLNDLQDDLKESGAIKRKVKKF